jgi:hypothetical protein
MTEPAVASVNRSEDAFSEAGTKRVEPSNTPNCLNALGANLNTDAWFDAAARACHPGSKRHDTAVTKAVGGDGQVTFDIPAGLMSSCWSAFAIVDDSLLPIRVELVDKDGLSRSLGVLSSNRGAIPSFGPFCALSQDFGRLRLRPDTVKSGRVSLAFYVFE